MFGEPEGRTDPVRLDQHGLSRHTEGGVELL